MPPALELLGPYAPPAVRVGDRLYCHYRRAWCMVTGRSAAPIRWPKGLIAEFGGDWSMIVMAEEKVVAASNARDGVVLPRVKGAAASPAGAG